MTIDPYIVFIIAFVMLFFGILGAQFFKYLKYRGSIILSLGKYNEKILRKLSTDSKRRFTINEINKFSKDSNKINDSLEWLKNKGYISLNKKEGIKITNKGLEKVFENFKREINHSDKTQEFLMGLLITLIGIMLAWGSFQLQGIQTSLMAQSNKLLEKSNTPNQAILEFIADKDTSVIPASILTTSDNLQKSEDKMGAIVGLTVFNFGRMDSNKVYCSDDSKDELYSYISPNAGNFKNIPAGSSNRSAFHIRYQKCQGEKENFCDKPELVREGIHNIFMSCECYGCRDQRIFNFTIPICIYNQNKSICDDFERDLK